eukprot:1573226-Pleurochrysis_carterae.AAC.2
MAGKSNGGRVKRQAMDMAERQKEGAVVQAGATQTRSTCPRGHERHRNAPGDQRGYTLAAEKRWTRSSAS